MYFKQLELTGFKSFADRTVLRMEPGMTAIVGPNGCGKSNVLDSLRWVLGEQSSKALRGGSMQDVIFNGSENRHPMGMAEVSVTFDNGDSALPVDFAEVQVTRRLYRSGESEYLLNKAPCRLKDIQELFMDTGIGTQAYSLIGQGKMDLILSQKPEDRRFLFEEAAGIIKYKNRKRLAIRRLDNAEQNLLRLGDIIAELERQMRSLKRQVNAAIRYRELSGQLRELEIRAAWLYWRELTAKVERLRKEFSEAQDGYARVTARVGQLEARHEELSLSQLEGDQALAEKREAVAGIDREMGNIEREVGLLRQQVEFSGEQQKRAEEEAAAFRQRAGEAAANCEKTEAAVDEAQGELEAAAATFEGKQAEHGAAAEKVRAAEEKLELIRAETAARADDRAKAQTEVETLEVRLNGIAAELASLEERGASEGERQQAVERELEAGRKQEAAFNERLAEVEKARAEARESHEAKSNELRDLNAQWQSLREQKSSLEARLRSLRELRDAYEGFAVGVRAIMRAKAENFPEADGVVGPAGDLISTEKTYERAVEAALGGSINNVIVNDADAAKRSIGFLRKHQAGRVTFLPLDIVRGGAGDTGDYLKGRKGVIGPALDFVQYEAVLQPAVENLLHSTLIVETLDDAIAIARRERRYPRLVTLDGEVVTSAGAVTGGRTKHESRGLLGRSAEIAELEDKTAALDRQITDSAERGEALTGEIQAAAQAMREREKEENALHGELGQLGVVLARKSTELDSLTESAASRAERCEQLAAQQAALNEQKQAASEKADSLATGDASLRGQMEEAVAAASEARKAQERVGAELGDLRVQRAGLEQRLEELRRDLERERRAREEALREAAARDEAKDRQAEQEERIGAQIKEKLSKSAGLSEQREAAQQRVNEATNDRKEVLDELSAVDEELKGLREQEREHQGKVHALELDLRSSEEKIGHFQERIAEAYQIALAQLAEEEVGTDEHDAETRDKLVADLRGKIARMGDVNLMAIEEYAQLEERYGFLTSQCEDLQKARDALMGVIARSDATIREMFMETFETVADQFREFFRILFNGGRARVYLLDEDDPLESGIEIEAHPPGKKPTSISLLSGGESAMTAIALLFSILKAKPTPFCVLDEVDAPLDDANIGRFLRIVDEFAEETQFIVITHNKQTMSKAGVMYGVTMQEKGVSQLISARLSEAKAG